jgi:hypothetical protein
VKICLISRALNNRLKRLIGLTLVGLALLAVAAPATWGKPLSKAELCVVRDLDLELTGHLLRRTSAPFFSADPYSPESTVGRDPTFQRDLAQTELVSHSHYDVKSDRQGKSLFEKTRKEADREYPRELVGPQRNLGIAVVEIQGKPAVVYKAFSGPAHLKGFEDGTSKADFLQPSVEREHDSEAKILSDLAEILPLGAHGKITLYTERIPCASCSLVIRNFKNRYPGIDIEVPKLSTW